MSLIENSMAINPRRNFGVTIGIVTGMVVNMAILQLGMLLYPPPASLDLADTMAMIRWMESMTGAQLLLVFWAHVSQAGIGALVGALSNRSVAQRTGMLVGTISSMFSMLNLLQIAHPMWFWLEIPLAIGLGWGIGRWLQVDVLE